MSRRIATMPDLAPWPAALQAAWQPLTRQAERLALTAGAGRGFQDRIAEVSGLIDRRDLARIEARLSERSFARALVFIWIDDEERAKASLSIDLANKLLRAQGGNPSRLLTTALCTLFLRRFDLLDEIEAGLFNTLGSVAKAAVRSTRPLRDESQPLPASEVVEAIRRFPELLLSVDGPLSAAREADLNELSLKDWLRSHGLLGLESGRYGVLLRQAIYLKRIYATNPAAQDQLGFLNDLKDSVLIRASAIRGLQFGHLVLEAMTSNPGATPCDRWLEVILEMAGDPRLEHSDQWRQWWKPIAPEAAQTARKWMSVEDLRLFLEAVENFGRTENQTDLLRMFPARKRFLSGLYDKGLIVETRLIMGNAARASVERQLGRVRLDISRLETASQTAVIVVDCGDFFLVEGSHSFRLYIYAGRPMKELMDRRVRSFTPAHLKEDLPFAHRRSHPYGRHAVVDVVHNGLWQYRALSYIVEELGVRLDPEALLSPADYQEMKRRFGLPYPGSRQLRV